MRLTQREIATTAVAMVTAAALDDFAECERIIREALATDSAVDVVAFVVQAAAEGVRVNATAANVTVAEALQIIGLRTATDLGTEDGS